MFWNKTKMKLILKADDDQTEVVSGEQTSGGAGGPAAQRSGGFSLLSGIKE